jgi:hypothetical protein
MAAAGSAARAEVTDVAEVTSRRRLARASGFVSKCMGKEATDYD